MGTAFYADEDFPRPVGVELRALGYDALTVQDEGRANQGIGNPSVLARATALGRAVLTKNRRDYKRLHLSGVPHAGIVACTDDGTNRPAWAGRIHARLAAIPDMTGRYEVIIRPNPSRKRTP